MEEAGAAASTGLARCSRGMVTGAKAGLGLASTEVGILPEEVTTTLTGAGLMPAA